MGSFARNWWTAPSGNPSVGRSGGFPGGAPASLGGRRSPRGVVRPSEPGLPGSQVGPHRLEALDEPPRGLGAWNSSTRTEPDCWDLARARPGNHLAGYERNVVTLTMQAPAQRIMGHNGSPSRKSNHSPHVRVRCREIWAGTTIRTPLTRYKIGRQSLTSWIRGTRWNRSIGDILVCAYTQIRRVICPHGSGTASWTVAIGPRRGPGWSPVAETGRGGPVPSIERRIESWRRSTACASGECVEVSYWRGRVLVRNSKVPEVMLRFSRSEWQAFMAHVATMPSPSRSEQGNTRGDG